MRYRISRRLMQKVELMLSALLDDLKVAKNQCSSNLQSIVDNLSLGDIAG